MTVSVTFLREILTAKFAGEELLSSMHTNMLKQIVYLDELLFAGKAHKLLIDASGDLVENLYTTIIFAFIYLLGSWLASFYRSGGHVFLNMAHTFLDSFAELFFEKLVDFAFL